jgi:hypothetical protein
MISIFILIILVALVTTIFYWINSYESNIKKLDTNCNLENFDIDKIHIIKRDPYYQKLINELIDNKAYLFTDDELKILKNQFQIYNINNDATSTATATGKPSSDQIQNISKIILLNCKNNLDNMDKTTPPNDIVYSPAELADIKYNLLNNDIYNKILGKFTDDVNTIDPPDCSNTKFLQTNKLKNYYYDLYGNNIISTPLDYMANYYTTINKSENEIDNDGCVPVKTVKGNSEFIIPDPFINFTPFQGPIQNADYWNSYHGTNIYNIDNERIINPMLAY